MAELERIVGYRIDREISRSSIASVYQGYQESLQRTVLIKQLHPQFVGDPEIRARFEREAHALARIKHKNIVHIYDYRSDEEIMVLVQEWIGGGSVAEYMRDNGPLTEPEAIALAVDVLQGLDVAHKSKVIHRDIKPSNLMLARDGAIKITDFGLAQFEGAAALTQQGAIMGTPAYMAPEMVNGQPGTPRCDLYSFGITLYEVLTGENPFQADHISQTLQRVLSFRPGKLEGVHDETNRLLQTLLSKDPNHRPATAGDVLAMILPLARDLEVEKGWEAVAGRKEKPAERESDADEAEPRPTTSTHSIRPVRKPTPPRWLVAASVTAMLLITAAVWFLTGDPAGPPGPPGGDSLAVAQTDVARPSPDNPPEQLVDTTGQATVPGDDLAPATGSDTTATETVEPPPVEEDPPPARQPRQLEDTTEAAPDTVAETPEQRRPSPVNPDTATVQLAEGSESSENSSATGVPDTGYVMLSVHPWAHVYYDNEQIGTTPLVHPLRLPAGRREIGLINPQFPPVNHPVDVSGGDTLRVNVDLYNEVGVLEFIDAIPWAEVLLDGDYIGRTPIGRAIFVHPGDHTLVFRHPSLAQEVIEFTVSGGDEPIRFRVDLTD